MSDSDDAEDAWAQHSEQSRRESEPTNNEADPAETDRQAAIREGYDRLADGDLNNVLSTRDDHLSAILYGLDASGGLDGLVAQAAARRGSEFEVDGVRRSAAIQQLLKYALHELDASVVEDALEAHKGYRADEVDSI